MKSPAYPIIGLDPDAFCTPDFFDLQSIPFMKRGWLVADYPDGEAPHHQRWKNRVASLALTRYKNGKISEIQRQNIFAWLERNRVDYPMLPPGNDPRFTSVGCEWREDWGWTRNACAHLSDEVEAVVSAKERESSWEDNPRWRQLFATKSIQDCVSELDEDERTWSVRRDARSLASLVAHPLRFGDTLKLIDPHADYERWHQTLDAMLEHANHGVIIELHCSRKKAATEGKKGPSETFRAAWQSWAHSQASGKLRSFAVFFWDELRKPAAELHDRHAIVGATTSDNPQTFAGISVMKGWDQAPASERNLETSFSCMSRKDQKLHWGHYCDGSTVFSRDSSEDVRWVRGS